MTKPFSVYSNAAITILFACSAIPAFANHGGGQDGGAAVFMGVEAGASMAAEAGASTVAEVAFAQRRRRSPAGGPYAPPAAGYAGPRAAGPYASRAGGFAARPGNNYSRPGGNFGGRKSAVWKFLLGAPCCRRRPVAFLWRPSRRPRTFGRAIGSRALQQRGRLPCL